MAFVRILICLFLLLTQLSGSVVEHHHLRCDGGDVYSGKISDLLVPVPNQSSYPVQNQLECATSCFIHADANTAVYTDSNTCSCFLNSTSQLTIEPSNSPDTIMSLRYDLNPVQECPTPCAGYSICTQPCKDDNLAGIPAMCTDHSAAQYTADSCEFSPLFNSKEFVLRNFYKTLNSSDIMFEVTFKKRLVQSALRVKFRGVLRGGKGAENNWGKWVIRFNGEDCSDPGPIESVSHNKEAGVDRHSSTGIQGICYGIPRGSIQVSLEVETGTNSEFTVGYGSHNTRLFVDEIRTPTYTEEQTDGACPSLPVFNIRQFSTTQSWSGFNPKLWEVDYMKTEETTALRINFDAVAAIIPEDLSDDCMVYMIKIDDANCLPQPVQKAVLDFSQPAELSEEYRSMEVEGHCYNVSAGIRKISVAVKVCHSPTENAGIPEIGWNGISQRLIVEEFRPGTNIIKEMDRTNDVSTLPEFNIVTFSPHHQSILSDADQGHLLYVGDFVKLHDLSGLRIAMTADARNMCGGVPGCTVYKCCRFYITIDSQECATPGPIEMISSTNMQANQHRPHMVDGICHGLPAGSHAIDVWVDKCRDHDHTGSCFFGFWESPTAIMISETFINTDVIDF